MRANAEGSATGCDDHVLVTRVARGDPAAFRILVERHAEPARRVAFRMLGDAGEAEDVAQEAMLKLWRGAAAIVIGPPGLGPWIYRVAMNASLDRLRRRRFRLFPTPSEMPDSAAESDGDAFAADRARRVAACLARLRGRQRAAVVLTYYEELPNAVAAETLSMKLKAFESLLQRARQALLAELRSEGILTLEDA